MKTGTIRSVALATVISLAGAGCAELTPGENAAVFGGISGMAAGRIARASGMSTSESIVTGAAVGAVVAATTYIIAKRQATERQRQIAEQRAKVYVGKVVARQKREEQAAKASGRKVAVKKKPRYIAVDTEKDQRTSPKAKKTVMIYDTQAGEVVGNNVYDVESTPSVGSTAKFETYSAEYVGSGS
jgi:membrane protein implicated in regulation of membrane protease activity